jgi:hypothetical protein
MRALGPAAVALLLVGAAMLAGCSSDRKKVCPRVAVLSEAGSLTRFAPGPGRDILDIDFQAEIGDLITSCEYPPAKGNRRVVVEMAPVFVVSRGAANGDRKATFTYFVSVVRNEQILSKQPYDITTGFPGNRSRVIAADDDPLITVDIPLAYQAAEYEYEVLVGFQLTPEQLEYNQRWRGMAR